MTRERVVYELENSIKLGISISREAREWLLDYLFVVDKIRAKIEQSRYGLASDGLDLALNIIDECIAESEK